MKIKYLGQDFFFDNVATPLTLQIYPFEICNKIVGNATTKINTVLDIGGNIGQFSYTANVLLKPKRIDVFEPNPEIFGVLEQNLSKYKNVHLYNLGVGSPTSKSMYFEKGRSGVGSLLMENAGDDKKVKSVEIKLIQDPSIITKYVNYDLIKIDVEGYEYEVIENLSGVKCKYIYIELSGNARSMSHTHIELLNFIRRKFGNFNIVYSPGVESTTTAFDLLLAII